MNVQYDILNRLQSQGIEARKSTGKSIPVADNESDLSVCFETLEHVPDPISFLRELERITKNNSRVLLSIPWVRETNILSKFHGGAFIDRDEADNHIFEFSPEDFLKIISYTGFSVVRYEKLHNYYYKYDIFSNYLLKKHFFNKFFPAVQAYILEK